MSSTANTYDIGDTVRLTAVFKSTAGVATNPTTVTFAYDDPSGNTTTLTSTGASVTNSTTGTFFIDVTADESGVWPYRVSSTGSVVAAGEAWFRVRTQRVT